MESDFPVTKKARRHMRFESRVAKERILFVAGIWLIVAAGYAFLRPRYSDAEIVSRAELIVVATVKESPMRYVRDPGGHGLPEHHVELQVSEFLKGTNIDRTIPVCVTWGLTPVTGGYYSNSSLMLDLRGISTNYPKEVIEVVDSGSRLDRFTGDIRTNHIWLLRHEPSRETSCRSNLLCIFDPEDIQPLRRSGDLMKHLK
jgi:hypothetical protein